MFLEKFNSMWRRKYLVDNGAGDGGGAGSGGGGNGGTGDGQGAGAGDGSGDGAGAGGGSAAGGAGDGAGSGAGGDGAGGQKGGGDPESLTVSKKDYEAMQKNLADFQAWHAETSQHFEKDPATGKWKTKEDPAAGGFKPPTEAELKAQAAATDQVQAYDKYSRVLDQVKEANKNDPFFSQNMTRMNELVSQVAIPFRTKEVLERALALAKGERMPEYIKLERQDAARKKEEEMMKQIGAGVIKGGSTGREVKNDDDLVAAMRLTDREMEAANRMIAGGMIDSLDTYKRNKLMLQRQNGEDE